MYHTKNIVIVLQSNLVIRNLFITTKLFTIAKMFLILKFDCTYYKTKKIGNNDFSRELPMTVID